MHVFMTGATGFVGHHILEELLRRGHTARVLVREGSEDKLPIPESARSTVDSSKEHIVAGHTADASGRGAKVEIASGDVLDIESIEGDLAGCDAVIHLVGIIEEDRRRGITFDRVHVKGTRHVVEQAKAAGVGRFIHMSANGARPDRDASAYHTTKWRAEEVVRGAGFEHAVIFRPTIVFGDPGEGRPEFASRLADTLIRPFPILPVFGDGRYQLQPVHIADVATAFVDALTIDPSPSEGLCVAGPDVFTYDEILDRIARGMGIEPKPKIHLPLWLSRLMVDTLGAVGLIPISPAQFRMLIEGNTCTDDAFVEIFGPKHVSFTPENLRHLRSDEH